MATVLIVDDEPTIRALVRSALERAGHHTLEAADGFGALDLARHARPDAIVLDIALPQLSGLEVCRRLDADAATAGTPVLLITGVARERDQELGRACISKPFRPDALLARLEALLAAPVR